MTTPEVPEDLRASIEGDRCVAFVGAGLSMNAGYPSWKSLLEMLIEAGSELRLLEAERAEELRIHVERPEDYLLVAEELRDRLGEGPFLDNLVRIFGERLDPTEAHCHLIHIPFSSIITTNYDYLIEDAYASEKRRSLYSLTYEQPGDLLDHLLNENFFLLKAHGSVDARNSMVITKRDYRTLIYRSPGYRSAMETVFNTKSIFFLGVGLKDPELEMLLSFLHDAFQGSVNRHFALLPDTDLTETMIGRWMRDYSVRCITYSPSDPSHPEVTEFLKMLPMADPSPKSGTTSKLRD